MSGFIEGVKGTIQSFIRLTPASPPPQTNDAAPPTLTPTESHRTAPATVDLTGTSPTHRSSRRDPRARPPVRTRYSDEEERLIKGDYGVPPDATRIPHPTSLFASSRKTIMGKPGAGASYKPTNTLNRNLHRGVASPPATYGRRLGHHVSILDDLQPEPTAATGYYSPSVNGEPATKRRRLGTLATTPSWARDVDHKNQVSVVSPSMGSVRRSPLTQQRPTTSSRYSDGSETRSAVRAGRPSQSEFDSTEKLAKSGRKNSRHPQASHPPSRMPNGAVTGLNGDSSDPIVLEEEPNSKLGSKATSKFTGFQQGIDHVSNRDASPQSSETTSRHFSTSKAKMTHSTHSSRDGVAKERLTASRASPTLRDRFRPAAISADEISSSDELAPARKRNASPTKHASKAKVAIAHRSTQEMPGDGYLLNYARAPGFEIHGPGLSLRKGGPNNSFRIAAAAKDGVVTKYEFSLSKVNQAHTDSLSRIRLNGSMDAAGVQLIVDLEFVKLTDILRFQNIDVVRSITKDRLYGQSVANLATMFSKPLPTNNKLMAYPTLRPHADTSPAPKTKQEGVIDGLTKSANSGQSRKKATNDGVMTQGTGLRSANRPTRSTRTNHPKYYEVDEETWKEPERYSEIYGLGPAWEHQLTYGSGRHRATVDFTDLPRLDEGEFLNDQLIDFYLLYLFDQTKDKKALSDKVYIFNTHFFSTLTRKVPGQKSSINYSAVARWTSKEDLFRYDYIVVPINQDVHWYLAIICNVSNISRKLAMKDLKDQSTPEPHTGGALGSGQKSDQAKPAEIEKSRSPLSLLSETQPIRLDDESDEMLFGLEESKLDLVDAHSAGLEVNRKAASEDNVQHDSPAAVSTGMEQLTLRDVKPTGTNARSSPNSKKSKRKSGPPAKKWDPDEPTIIILDSLGSGARSQAVRALKNYLLEEGREKRGIEAEIPQNAFYAKASQIPMQENFSDCGVYLLGYMQKFFEDPDGFKNRLLSGEMRTETDWPQMAMPQMRDLMRDVLQGLYKNQEEKRKAERKAKKSASTSKVAERSTKDTTAETKPVPEKRELLTNPTPELTKASADTELAETEGQSQCARTLTEAPTPRLGSPFDPTLCVEDSIASRSPSPETFIGKVDDSPTPPPMHTLKGEGDEQQDWLQRQDEKPVLEVPLRRTSPLVVIPSPKQRLERTNEQANEDNHTTEVRNPKRSKTTPSPKTDTAKMMSKQATSPNGTVGPSSTKFKNRISYAVSSGNAAQKSPIGSPAPVSRGSSQNPISVDESQEIIIVTSPKPKKQKVVLTPKAAIAWSSPRSQRHRQHGASVKRGISSPTTRQRVKSPTNGAGFVGDALDSRLRHAQEFATGENYDITINETVEASQFTADEDEIEVVSPGLRKRAAQEDFTTLGDDTVPETPPHRRNSPGGTLSQPLAL